MDVAFMSRAACMITSTVSGQARTRLKAFENPAALATDGGAVTKYENAMASTKLKASPPQRIYLIQRPDDCVTQSATSTAAAG